MLTSSASGYGSRGMASWLSGVRTIVFKVSNQIITEDNSMLTEPVMRTPSNQTCIGRGCARACVVLDKLRL